MYNLSFQFVQIDYYKFYSIEQWFCVHICTIIFYFSVYLVCIKRKMKHSSSYNCKEKLIMIVLNVLLVLCSIHSLVIGFSGYTFESLKDPKPLTEDAGKNVVENWITQPLDHFNHRDTRTWSMVIIIIAQSLLNCFT